MIEQVMVQGIDVVEHEVEVVVGVVVVVAVLVAVAAIVVVDVVVVEPIEIDKGQPER